MKPYQVIVFAIIILLFAIGRSEAGSFIAEYVLWWDNGSACLPAGGNTYWF
jgi:hypothetical protein